MSVSMVFWSILTMGVVVREGGTVGGGGRGLGVGLVCMIRAGVRAVDGQCDSCD